MRQAAGTILPMGPQELSDQTILQQAKTSALRLTGHLLQSVGPTQGPESPGRPGGELEAAAASLRNLAAAIEKEPDRR